MSNAAPATAPAAAKAAAPVAAPITVPVQPNLFQVHNALLHVSYATSGLDGKPHFAYHDAIRNLTFSGDQIEVEDTVIGKLVTVRIVMTIDSGSTTFSLLVPTVNLDQSGYAPIHTIGITTLHRFSIIPVLMQGQTELYTVTQLSGSAQHVAF